MNRLVPKVLFFSYLVFFALLSFNPYSRAVWAAENLPIVLIVALLVFLFQKKIYFSNTAYFLMSIFIFMHTIGGYYTFERVPFGWFDHWFGFKRNMYDRVAHFAVGFYAFAMVEVIDNHKLVNRQWLSYFTAFCFIVTIAGLYEIIEWLYAFLSDPVSGLAFLGSQGDIWDAQKDMLMDTLGAVIALSFYFFKKRLVGKQRVI